MSLVAKRMTPFCPLGLPALRSFAMRILCAIVVGIWGQLALAEMPQAPEVAARAYLLLDVTASQVLAAKQADLPVEPASLTKLMTAYLVFDAIKSGKISLKQALPVSERASAMPGSRMFIEPNMQVPVEDLVKGMVVQSGNDATMALAEAVGGSAERFVGLMNAQAKALGMQHTTYKNPEGMGAPGQLTTARDLGLLATRLLADFPEYVGYSAIKKYHYPGTPAANDSNRNLLLFRDPTVDGLKTGRTDAAGYCMIATAKRDFPTLGAPGAPGSARRLLAIVLGADSENARANESQKLLNWGFSATEPVKLFEGGAAVVSPVVWKGSASTVALGRVQPIIVAVPAGAATHIKTTVVRQDPLMAPIAAGQVAATLRVAVEGQPLVDVPLQALEGVSQAGVLRRAWDSLRLWIR